VSLDVGETITEEEVDGPEYKIFVSPLIKDFSVFYVQLICFYTFYAWFEFSVQLNM